MTTKKKSLLWLRFPEFLLAIFVIISGTILAFHSKSFVVNFSEIGFSVLSSVERGVFSLTDGIKKSIYSVNELFRIRTEYNQLIQRLNEFELMRHSNAEIRRENERLREQLGFVESLSEKNYPAQIIARDVDAVYATITINKGSVHGITKNMPVIAYQNGMMGLVGKVTHVGRYTSTVLPVYNLNCTVSARIQNTRDLGLVSGLGGSSRPLSLQYIRKGIIEKLHYGDIVVTSGENDNYLPDIPIGTIEEIRTVDYDSSLDIDLTPVIDFSRLEMVVAVQQRIPLPGGM
ncbi:MAG: rod shape-determining protein MreC [Treponema sp.]|nr:rod shape-determining protein MreC [Treponema sp.]